MDLVGPLPETEEHNRYLLTVMDTFSKWPLAIPLPNKKASTIADALYKHLISVHGCPEELLSDMEHTLLADSVALLCKRFGISRITSSAYSPWQNGSVERFHRFLGASLSIYASESKKDWDQWVDCVLFTYRVSVHEKTGESPYRTIFNRDPRLAGDIIFKPILGEGKAMPSTDVLVDQLESWFQKIRLRQKEMAEKDIDKANAKSKKVEVSFSKGDWVLLYEPPVTHQTVKRPWSVPRKFQDCLTGPHRIERGLVNQKNEVKVFNMRRGLSLDVHVSRVIPYNPWSDDFPDTAQGSLVPGHGIRRQGDAQESVALSHVAAESGDSEFRNGDNVKFQEFVVAGIEDPCRKTPFVVGTICDLGTKKTKASDNKWYRPVNIRIWGNHNDNPLNVYRPGWLDKKGIPYFKKNREHHSHRPYTTNDMNGANISTYVIILAGFELSNSDKIPMNVLKFLHSSEWTEWEFETD
jgi:hypothetical protein